MSKAMTNSLLTWWLKRRRQHPDQFTGGFFVEDGNDGPYGSIGYDVCVVWIPTKKEVSSDE